MAKSQEIVQRAALMFEIRTCVKEADKILKQELDCRDNGAFADVIFDVEFWLSKAVKSIGRLYDNPAPYGLNGDISDVPFDDDDMTGAID